MSVSSERMSEKDPTYISRLMAYCNREAVALQEIPGFEASPACLVAVTV